MKRICKECGQEFEATNGMQQYCKREHRRKCVVCGKLFVVSNSMLSSATVRETCSRKCAAAKRRQTNIEKYGGPAPMSSPAIQAKIRQTTVERYGVEHAMQSEQFKEKSRQTNLERYGVEHSAQRQEAREALSDKWKNDVEFRGHVKAKQIETNMKRYGCSNPLGNSEIRAAIRASYKEKTGYEYPTQNPEVRAKVEATNVERYGVKRPIQNADVMQKLRATNRERYGVDIPTQNINIQRKVQATCLARYGNTCFFQSDLGKKLHDTKMRAKYGTPNFAQTAEWKMQRMTDPSKIDNLMAFDTDPAGFINSHYQTQPTLLELCADIGTGTEAASLRLQRAGCQNLVAYVFSYMENEVYNTLKSIDNTLKIERNTHKIITPYELDLYLPDYKIGIECNPTATHNSSVDAFDATAEPMKPGYHLMKTKKCEEQGIFLFHIFGSEWTYSRTVIQAMLRNLLHKNEYRIYARNCTVRTIQSSAASQFLNENHRQGTAGAAVRYGLFYQDELVAVMTFGKMRNSIGTDRTDLSDCWELVRFCTKLDTSVVGGASKLFKQFLRDYQPARVRSFSDRAHTRGDLYPQLGFKLVRASDPGYVWVDSRTDISYHRYSAQKQNIQKFLHDPDIDLNKTEKQIMEEHGFLQVFDSGTILWEYTANTSL